MWLGGVAVAGRTGDRRVPSSIPSDALPGNDLGQVVHTHVPLSPSSIIWYWSKGNDAFWLESNRVPGGK